MKTSFAALAVSALLFNLLLAAPPDNAEPKTPDAKAATRLKFQAYDGDPKKPETMTFQVNVPELKLPTEFLKLGGTLTKTNFKLTKFDFKVVKNPTTGEAEDVSELTIVNTATHQEFVLVFNKLTAVPN